MKVNYIEKLKLESKKYFNQEILNTKIKYIFKLVVRFITNKYYKDLFFYFFIFIIIGLFHLLINF